MPLVFYAHREKTCAWVAHKADLLVKKTLYRCHALMGQDGVAHLTNEYLLKYVLVVYTWSPRVKFGDFIVMDSLSEALSAVGAIMFVKHPYEDDDAHFLKPESVCGPLTRFMNFGNFRMYIKEGSGGRRHVIRAD